MNPSLVYIEKTKYGSGFILNISCNDALFLNTYISKTTLVKLKKQIDGLLKEIEDKESEEKNEK